MAFDHLVGDDPGLEDPVAFAVSAVLTLAAAVVIFGVVIPRAKRGERVPERAATRGAIVSALAAVPGIGLIWLGVTWVIAAGGIALGLLGVRSERRLLAWGAIVVGVAVLGVCAVFSDWGSET